MPDIENVLVVAPFLTTCAANVEELTAKLIVAVYESRDISYAFDGETLNGISFEALKFFVSSKQKNLIVAEFFCPLREPSLLGSDSDINEGIEEFLPGADVNPAT